jgi:hypothetical protein
MLKPHWQEIWARGRANISSRLKLGMAGLIAVYRFSIISWYGISEVLEAKNIMKGIILSLGSIL